MFVDDFDMGKEGAIHKFFRDIKNVLQNGNVESYDTSGDITYHFLIDKDGTIYEGRSLTYEGAHVHGQNPQNIGVAFLGNYSRDPLSDAQVNSAKALISSLNDAYDVAGEADGNPYVFTHKDLAPPSGIYARPVELVGAQQQIDAIKKWSMQGSNYGH